MRRTANTRFPMSGFKPLWWEPPGRYLCTMLCNLYRKKCETCGRHEHREETGEKTKFPALYIPLPEFKNMCLAHMAYTYNGYFLRLSNFCGILRVYRNRRNWKSQNIPIPLQWWKRVLSDCSVTYILMPVRCCCWIICIMRFSQLYNLHLDMRLSFN